MSNYNVNFLIKILKGSDIFVAEIRRKRIGERRKY